MSADPSIGMSCNASAFGAVHRATTKCPSLSGLDQHDIDDILLKASRFEDELRGSRILITGATGWFGTWLLDSLVALNRSRALGLSIVAVSRDPGAFKRRHRALHAAAEIEWFEADVRDSLLDAPGSFSHIVHAATDSSASNVDSADKMFETIVLGTLNVLKLAACHPASKMLLVSSGAVYGPQPETIVALSEDHVGAPDVLDPSNAYAEGKRAAEHLAAIWHATHGVDVTIARCFAFVGPHMPFDAHFAIGNFIRDATDGNAIQVAGDGRSRRTYLYMSDLVVWLLAVLVEGRPMRPYNVGAPHAITIAALAEQVAAAIPGALEVRILGKASLGRDYVPDVTRTMGELGVDASVSLAAAITRTARWRREGCQACADAGPHLHRTTG